MEGTNARVTLPDRQHSSATPSPRATYTPSFQTNGPLWKTMLSILYIHNSQILENNSQSCNLEQCFGDLIAMEGTNANGAMPNRQHTSATPSPRATYTPTFQNKGQIWKTMVSQLELPQFPQEEGGQVQCFGDLIPMEGTNAKWCHAKSAAYVRDAKPEGDVHSNLPKQRSPLENNGFLSIKFSLCQKTSVCLTVHSV